MPEVNSRPIATPLARAGYKNSARPCIPAAATPVQSNRSRRPVATATPWVRALAAMAHATLKF